MGIPSEQLEKFLGGATRVTDPETGMTAVAFEI
jgi:hypothetical protein